MEVYEKAYKYFNRALELNPEHEASSLGIYLCLVELEDYANAITEMERFLSFNAANLYKTTISELLEDLENGYAKEFESRINELAKKSGITINTDCDRPPSAS